MKIKFPENSITVCLNDIFDYVIGGDWGKDPEFQDENYSLAFCLRGSEFKNWEIDKGKTASLRKIKKSNILSRKLQEGDILIEISGGGPEQPVGRTVLIDKTVLSFEPEIPKICTNFLRLARPTKHINPKYLNLFLTFFYKSGEIVAYQGGSNNLRNLKFDDYISIQIPLIPLPEQHRIVAKIEELFSSLDKGIESLKTAQQQLKVYRQAVLKWAFEGRFTNANVKEGELPEGWNIKKVDEIAYVNPKLPSNNIPDNLEVSFLPMRLVEEVVNKIHLTEFKKYGEVKKGFTPMIDGDVIFAKITPCMENGKIAVVHSLKNKIAFGSTEFHVLRCKIGFLNFYLFYFLVQERIRQEAERNMIGAVGQRRVPKKFLEDLLIPLPPTLSEQHRIVSEIEKRLSVADKLEESIATALQQAEALRQSILKKAFEGKLLSEAELEECRNDPNWEPASVLLERIASAKLSTKRAERHNKTSQDKIKPEKKE